MIQTEIDTSRRRLGNRFMSSIPWSLEGTARTLLRGLHNVNVCVPGWA